MNKYTKKSVPLKILEYPNGTILPQKKNEKDFPMWGLGGVCDCNNHFSAASFYDGGWATHGGYYEWDNEEYVDEYVVYVGLFFSHWGHFLIDLSGRLWALVSLCERYPDIKVAYLGEEEPKGNYLRFFELLGVNRSQLICVEKPTRFKKVFLPELSFKSCNWYSNEFIEMFDSMAVAVEKRNKDFEQHKNIKKIYFSRRNFAKAKNSEIGEEYFEQIFNDNGFNSISPEKLSLDEQIFLWNHAEEIACINGSIILNVVFSCNPDLKITILNKTSIFHENPYILLQARGLSAEFVDVYYEPFKRYPKSLGEGPYCLINTDYFLFFCKNHNYSVNIRYKYIKSFLNYFWLILALKGRLRKIISKVVPERIKKLRRNNVLEL